ncbi:MAG: DUF697 domain-containing protein [Thiolinea sp.]
MESNNSSKEISKSAPKKKAPAKRRRPTLAHQVEEQAKLINELHDQLHEKNKEIKVLSEKNKSIDELNRSITEVESLLERYNAENQTDKVQLSIAGNVSEKLQELEIKLKASNLQSQHLAAQNIVKTHMVAGAALALLPVPIFDLAALSGTQLNLLRSLCRHYDVNFDEQRGKALLTSLISGSLPLLTVMGLSSFARLLPGIGTIGGSISMTVFSSAFIYATGQVFIHHFEYGGTLENFDGKHWRKFFKKKFAERKALVKEH